MSKDDPLKTAPRPEMLDDFYNMELDPYYPTSRCELLATFDAFLSRATLNIQ